MSYFAALNMATGTFLVVGCVCSQTQPSPTCAPTDVFESRYKIADVILDTPLNFTDKLASKLVPASLLAKLNGILPDLPITKGQVFHDGPYEATMDVLSGRYGSGSIHPGEQFRMAIVFPEVRPSAKCDPQMPTVDVIYHIYTSDPVYYATRVFEAKPAAITRNLAPSGTIPSQGTIQPLPYLGFNSSRNLIFGSKLSMETGSGLFSSMEADVSGSQNSATASVFMAGSRQFPTGWLHFIRWSLGYRYENLPGDNLTLKSGRAIFSVLGASHASGALGVIARFGSSVEGGNAQASSGDTRKRSLSLIQTSPYAAVKSYAGLTFNQGRQSFAGSYGIQFGSGSASPSWDYTKHVTNFSYSSRIIKTEHKPLTLDVQAGAGYIVGNEALIPVAERFFGGNVERNFIEGDSWHLPGNPLVRSFAELEFGRAGTGKGIGGRDFYSFNATVSQTVRGMPAVPTELAKDPSFRRKLGGQVMNARNTDKLTYLAESPDFGKIVSQLGTATPLLTHAMQRSAEIRAAMPGLPSSAAVASNLKDLDDEIVGSNGANAVILNAQTNRATGLSQVRTLAVGFLSGAEKDDCNAIAASLITQILCSSQALNDLLKSSSMTTQVADLLDVGQKLISLRDQLAVAYFALRKQAYLAAADAKPVQDELKEIASQLADLYNTAFTLKPATGPPILQLETLLGDLREACGKDQMANCGRLRTVDAETVSGMGDWLAIGTGELTPPFLSAIVGDAECVSLMLGGPALATTAAKLSERCPTLGVPGGTAPAATMAKLNEQTDGVRNYHEKLRKTMETLKRPHVEVRAIHDTKFTGRLLDVIFRELNLYSAAPFAMIDVARIGETHSLAFQKTRYAAGPGVRFSLVNFNVNMGYAVNLNKEPGERFGSVYFSLSISDLFR